MAKPEIKRSVSVRVERKTTVTLNYDELRLTLAEAVGCPNPKEATVDINEYGASYVNWTETEREEEN